MFKVVDNYLSSDSFESLISALDVLDRDKAEAESTTSIERAKSVFELKNLPPIVTSFIDQFASDSSKEIIRELTGWQGELISLLELSGFGGYAPYHTMKSGGFLGSHIDHTFIKDDDLIKVANCIFYANRNWHDRWGGETVFFDRSGFVERDRVSPLPNRMLFFTHDVEGFHGVSEIECPESVVRRSFYMDFYIKACDLESFREDFYSKNSEKYIHAPCLTTFIPIPKSNGKIDFLKILSRSTLGYVRNYLRYLIIKSKYKHMRYSK